MDPETVQKIALGKIMAMTQNQYTVQARSCWQSGMRLRRRRRTMTFEDQTVRAMLAVAKPCSLWNLIYSLKVSKGKTGRPGAAFVSRKRCGAFRWRITVLAIRLAVVKKIKGSSARRPRSLWTLMKVRMMVRRTASPRSIQIATCQPVSSGYLEKRTGYLTSKAMGVIVSMLENIVIFMQVGLEILEYGLRCWWMRSLGKS